MMSAKDVSSPRFATSQTSPKLFSTRGSVVVVREGVRYCLQCSDKQGVENLLTAGCSEIKEAHLSEDRNRGSRFVPTSTLSLFVDRSSNKIARQHEAIGVEIREVRVEGISVLSSSPRQIGVQCTSPGCGHIFVLSRAQFDMVVEGMNAIGTISNLDVLNSFRWLVSNKGNTRGSGSWRHILKIACKVLKHFHVRSYHSRYKDGKHDILDLPTVGLRAALKVQGVGSWR